MGFPYLYQTDLGALINLHITFPFIAGASILLPAELTAAWAAPSTALLGRVLLCLKTMKCWKDESQPKSGKVGYDHQTLRNREAWKHL